MTMLRHFLSSLRKKLTACNHRLPKVKTDAVSSKIMDDDGTRFPSLNKAYTVVLCLSWELVERNHHNHHSHPHNHHHNRNLHHNHLHNHHSNLHNHLHNLHNHHNHLQTDHLLHVHHDHLDHHGLHDLLPLLEARISSVRSSFHQTQRKHVGWTSYLPYLQKTPSRIQILCSLPVCFLHRPFS